MVRNRADCEVTSVWYPPEETSGGAGNPPMPCRGSTMIRSEDPGEYLIVPDRIDHHWQSTTSGSHSRQQGSLTAAGPPGRGSVLDGAV